MVVVRVTYHMVPPQNKGWMPRGTHGRPAPRRLSRGHPATLDHQVHRGNRWVAIQSPHRGPPPRWVAPIPTPSRASCVPRRHRGQPGERQTVNIRLRRAIALLAFSATALGMAGCSRSSEDVGAGGSSGGAEDKVVKIGVIAPMTGSLSGFGLGIKNSVDLAVNQANASGKLKGWKLVLDAQDDTGKAEPGAAAANKLASDATVAGVIGTVNSSV